MNGGSTGPVFPTLSARSLARVGVVDVGSNSVRLVVFDGAARSPAYFYNEKVMAGLGEGLAGTGVLNPDGAVRALAALRRFVQIAPSMGVGHLTCVATAAVREAADGEEFCRTVEKETGLQLTVVNGEDEARLSAQGVALGWPDASGLVCDIGGSSMELAELSGGKVGRCVTSPLGPFRLEQVTGGEKALTRHIAGIVAGLADEMGTDHDTIFLVGGSWRAIARLDMERTGYPMTVLHEYRMDPKAINATADWIAESDLSELRARAGLSSARIELVPLASKVLRELIQTFAPKEIAVSSYGIREGMLYAQMSKALRKRDPLIEAARFSEKHMSRMPGFGKRLYAFLQPLFRDATPGRDRLIRAACLLHDTAWRAHPDYRADACFDNVTRANMAGISHAERVFLGLALLHRYKNSRAKSPMAPLFKLLTEDQIRDAEVLGKAMRFGAMFAFKDPQSAGSLKLKKKANTLSLKLTKKGKVLFGEVAEARFRSLAGSLNATPEVKGV